jgi:hypothetical protein
MTLFEASSYSNLRRILAGFDITVPQRTKGRTKNHTERYAMAHLLSALMRARLIGYPLRLFIAIDQISYSIWGKDGLVLNT